MVFRDLFSDPLPAPGSIDRERLFRDVREKLARIPLGHFRSEGPPPDIDHLICLCRAGITGLAAKGDLSGVQYIVNTYSHRSQDVLAVSKGAGLDELDLLEVRGKDKNELDSRLENIQAMLDKYLRPATLETGSWKEVMKGPLQQNPYFGNLSGRALELRLNRLFESHEHTED